MMHALNELCIAATKGTPATANALAHFLTYFASNPEAEIVYRQSDMILTIDSDAAYLVAAKARSRAAGYFYLGNKDNQLFNGPIYIYTKLILAVMSSAAEAECGGLYLNAKESVPMRNTSIELGHPQPPDGTPIRTNNSTADGIMNQTVKPKRSKSMDMQFWWLADRVEQNQFRIFWAPGSVNLADSFSKKYPASHHIKGRPTYLHIDGKSPSSLQGCAKILTSGTHGDLEEEIYMDYPKSLDEDNSFKCLLLKKAVYGLKQASWQWFKKAVDCFKQFGFEDIKIDPCLLKKTSGTGNMYVCVYVDDCYAIGYKSDLDQLINDIRGKTEYNIKVLHDLNDYLSCQVKFNKEKTRAWLGQPYLIKKLEEKFGESVKKSITYKTPGMPGVRLIRLTNEEKEEGTRLVSTEMHSLYRT
jgi:hypothetical protein